MRRVWILAFGVILAFVTVTGAAAQTVSSTTGAINGKVTDESDAALPGVTITISSPSMQGTRNTVSGADGTFRFPAIAPGEYKVTYELGGLWHRGARGRPGRPRLYRDAQQLDEGGVAAGNGHRDRRVPGR